MNTYTCHRCSMTFRVVEQFKWADNITRCAEGCGLAMADRDKGDAVEMVTIVNETELVA